jgi:hypothetical protein
MASLDNLEAAARLLIGLAFDKLRRNKSPALHAVAATFGAGLTALALTLIAALIYAGAP